MKPFLLALAFGVFTASTPITAAAADRAIIVLDGSGSMWAQIDGVARIAIARQTIKDVLAGLPEGLELGLMAYGHREKGSCSDIETLVQPATETREAISAAVDRIVPKGKTPLSSAVQRAAEELRYTEEKATVILVTDGIETCSADPCALATELEKGGVGFTAHVVGFGLTEDEGRKVACLAENTGGKYIQAKDAGALSEALIETVAEAAQPAAPPAPEPAPAPAPQPAVPDYTIAPVAVMAEGDDPLPGNAGNAWEIHRAKADGSRGEYVTTEYGNEWKGTLEPGDYVIQSRYGEAIVEMPVTIEAGKVAEPLFVLNAGTLSIRPLAQDGGDPVDGAAVVLTLPDGRETTGYGAVTFIVPAGDRKIRVRIGAGEVAETIPVAAGEVVSRDIVVGVGRAVLNAVYVPGMKAEDGLAVEIVKALKKPDGSRESVTYAYGADTAHDLPPGDYVLIARMGQAEAEAPFSIKVGDTTQVEAVLNAGVLAISSPGADFIEIFSAKKDIQGKRKSMAYNYGETFQTTLPAGDYVIVTRKPDGGGEKETETKVVAGERTETNVTLP